ncbi:hypothetical protein JOM56_008961 [Amanita muscaria]
MDVDDEWTPAPVLHMDNAPRPWYNPEPQPAWNNLDLKLEDPHVENASQDVPGWYVNLRGSNDTPRPIWRNLAITPTPTPPAPRPWHNPEPQPAWNNLELELDNPSVKNVPQDVPGWYVNTRGQNDQPRRTWRNLLPVGSARRVENAHVRDCSPTPSVPAPRPWQNPEPQPMWNNLELRLESPAVENARQVQNQDVPGSYVHHREQNDQPHHTGGTFMPVVSVRRIKNALVRETTSAPTAPMVLDRKEQKAPKLAVPPLATKAEKASVFGVPVSATKVEKALVRVAPSPAKARVPGISASTRTPENTCALGVLASVKKTCALDVPFSARKIEKSRAPSIPTPSPRAPVPSKSIPIRLKPVVPPRIDFTNMSSSSKVKLEDMPKVDEHPVQTCISWPTLAYIVQPGSPKATTSYRYQNSPTTPTHHTRAEKDVVMIENDCIDPTISVPSTEDEDTTSDDTHLAHLTEPLQPVVDHAEDGEPTVDRNAAPEDDVGTGDANEEDSSSAENTAEAGEDKSEETEEETEEERQARIARLMTEVFGDGEDSDDEEPPPAKDSTSAASEALTMDGTESITDWSLDTPDDVGTEGNGSVEVADRDEEDEDIQASYRAQLLAEIFGDGVEDGQIVQEVPLVPAHVPATRDPRKRKREDGGPSPMANLVNMDSRKRMRDGEAPPAPTLVTRDPRKRRREDEALPMASLVSMDSKKRKRDGEAPPAPTLVTRDPRKRKREDEIPPALSVVTRDPRKRLKG